MEKVKWSCKECNKKRTTFYRPFLYCQSPFLRAAIPNDSSVEIHEASGKASSIDAYDKLIRYCRSEISIALLGQCAFSADSAAGYAYRSGIQLAAGVIGKDKPARQAASWPYAIGK